MKRSFLLLACFAVAVPAANAQKSKKEDLGKFIKQLGAKDSKERIAACEGIAEIGELKRIYARDACEPLVDVVRKDSDAGVRAAAASTLGRIDADPEKAVPALIEGLKDKERNVQIASATALGALRSGATAAVEPLSQLDKEARAEQARAREELDKARKDGDKAKIAQAQARARAIGLLAQATGDALKSIGGK